MGKFYPASARHAKAQDFLELKQGTMTILEYVAKLTELARFGDDYVASDMAKVKKFEDGLKLSIRGKIGGLLLQDMDYMVRTALAIKREIEDARSIRDTSDGDKRKEGKPSSSSGKKQRTYVPRGFLGQGRGFQGQSKIRAPSQSGSMTCYHCHQPGHVRRDCLKRQGSQSHGTPQSQSSVGHTQTQYAPSYPSMGQGNRYLSQGATRAPVVSQIGQRGQSMGRGRGQGPQVRTSGTQGRVYTVTPQTEPTDPSVIQGMFLLSRLWERVLFDSGASHSLIAASCVNVLGLKV